MSQNCPHQPECRNFKTRKYLLADSGQTLFRWLDKQPLAKTIAELQAQVHQFDLIYNTQRRHQGLPGRITPQQSWDATQVAEPPRPAPAPTEPVIPAAAVVVVNAQPLPDGSKTADVAVLQETKANHCPTTSNGSQIPVKITGSIHHPGKTGTQHMRVYTNGVVNFAGTLFSLTRVVANRVIIADWDTDRIVFATTIGEVIAEYAWPPKERNIKPSPKPDTSSETSPQNSNVTNVLRHQVSTKS